MKKKCSKCLEEKLVEEFHKDASKKDGLLVWCKTCNTKRVTKWRKENASHLAKYMKEYQEKNADTIREYAKKYGKPYYAKNADRIKRYFRKYSNERYATDPLYKLSLSIRGSARRITKAVKNGKIKRHSSLKYLGCSLVEYKAHIESQWEEDMSWENHGEWHIDHIIPVDWFVKNSDNPWEANHYTNLRPLWAKENIVKGNKILDNPPALP